MSEYQTYHVYVNNDPEDKIVIVAAKVVFERNFIRFEATFGAVSALFNADEIVGFVCVD